MRTDGSALKMATGMARSVTGAPGGLAEMMNRQDRPLSRTMPSPRNSANRLAVLIDVDFCPAYSASVLDMDRFSAMSSISSSSGSAAALVASTSSHWLAVTATAA